MRYFTKQQEISYEELQTAKTGKFYVLHFAVDEQFNGINEKLLIDN